MSYNGSGTFQINSAGQPVVTGTTITSTAFNALTADLATGLSTAITKDGQTATTARILFALGISSTLTTDATSATTGSIITAGGISAQKALWVGTTANVAGTTDATSATTGTITTAGGISAQKALWVGTTANVAGTTDATSATTGTITTAGGISAQKALWVGTTSRHVGAATFDAAITYGGVTLSNSVTGTGSMVLSASPTFTGTVTTAELTTTGIKTAVGTALGTAGVWYNTSLTVGSQAPCVWILTASQPSGVSVGSWMITTENGNGNGYVFPMSTGGGMECQMSGTTAQVRGTTYSSTITFRWTKLITA